MLKLSGTTLGGIALGSPLLSFGNSPSNEGSSDPSQTNSYFNSLPAFTPPEPLAPDEMRITILGSSCIPRLSQECNSVYVEVGSGDQFVFDCGTGVAAKYNAMGIPMSRMDKIFFTHLHADHTSDLTHIYCFGPAEDRKSPLFIFGPENSGFTYYDPNNVQRGPYNDGTRAFCESFRDMHRWHTESFSFGVTSLPGYTLPTQEDWGLPAPLVKVSDDSFDDGYCIYPVELNWQNYGKTPGDNVAYHNKTTGVRITHFPAIHTRMGSVSYRLDWNGLSMIFSGDSKPNKEMLSHAKGVDVLIHEMVMPAQVWAEKNSGLKPGDPDYEQAYNYALMVQNSSHTPQGAFGYIMSQIIPPPRLTVATHFQAEDDTTTSAIQSVRNHAPVGELAFASDFMVINVSASRILQRRAIVSPYAFYPVSPAPDDVNTPKYWKWQDDAHTIAVGNPTAQIITTDEIPAVDPNTGEFHYNTNGY
ncbi:MAG: MBL fold metallo-hydrolase [Bacteroidales bacterium]